MKKALAVAGLVAALTLTGCNSDDGTESAGATATAAAAASTSAGFNWAGVRKDYATDFTNTCENYDGDKLTACLGLLRVHAQSLLRVLEDAPAGRTASDIRHSAQVIVDDVDTYYDERCAATTTTECIMLPSNTALRASTVDNLLDNAAGAQE